MLKGSLNKTFPSFLIVFAGDIYLAHFGDFRGKWMQPSQGTMEQTFIENALKDIRNNKYPGLLKSTFSQIIVVYMYLYVSMSWKIKPQVSGFLPIWGYIYLYLYLYLYYIYLCNGDVWLFFFLAIRGRDLLKSLMT